MIFLLFSFAELSHDYSDHVAVSYSTRSAFGTSLQQTTTYNFYLYTLLWIIHTDAKNIYQLPA